MVSLLESNDEAMRELQDVEFLERVAVLVEGIGQRVYDYMLMFVD